MKNRAPHLAVVALDLLPRAVVVQRHPAVFFGYAPAHIGVLDWHAYSRGELVEGPATELSTRLRFADAAPLLEKKWNFYTSTLLADRQDPRLFHRPSARTALAAHDYPVHSLQVQRSKIFQQGLNRQKTNARLRFAEVTDAREPMLLVFDTYPPPNMR